MVLLDSAININYSMLLGRPWLRDARVAHDWGNNIVTIQGNGTIITTMLTKHREQRWSNSKSWWYHQWRGRYHIHYKTIIVPISVPYTFQYVKTTKSTHIGTEVYYHNINRSNIKLISIEGDNTNRYEPIVALENKVYPKTYCKH
jgi:hypothetical protein